MKHSATNASIAITLGLGLLWLVDNEPLVAQAQGADGNSTYYLPLVLRQFEGLVLKSYPDRLPGNATK